MPRWNNINCGFQKGHKAFIPVHSDATKTKMSLTQKAIGNRPPTQYGHKYNLGRKMSEETKEKIRLSNIGKHTPVVIIRGENHPNWRGGKTSLILQIRGCFKYRQWRSDVFTRDKFSCQECGDHRGHNLNADHIEPFSFILKNNSITDMNTALQCEKLWDIDNGRTLCEPCHRKTDT